MKLKNGTVKRFSDEKGFGFIKPDGGGVDVFVHVSAIEGSGVRTLAHGVRVSFQVEKTEKGVRAVNVTALPARAKKTTASHGPAFDLAGMILGGKR